MQCYALNFDRSTQIILMGITFLRDNLIIYVHQPFKKLISWIQVLKGGKSYLEQRFRYKEGYSNIIYNTKNQKITT